MKKIKVLHIIKSLGRGGAEMLLPETLKLHSETFEFHYIYFLSWKTEMVPAIEKNGGKVTCMPVSNNIQLLLKYNEVDNYVKSKNIKIIHCHLPWAGFLGRLLHLKSKIPVLYTEHNMQERYHFVTKYLNKVSYNWQTLAIGVSKDVSDSIEKNISPKIPVKTFLNGVNTESFSPNLEFKNIRSEFNIPDDAILIGNVAVFRFQKRIVEWLKVFKKVSQNHQNVYGIIVGFGPLEKEIKSELVKLELEDKVFFPGLIRNVKPYFSAFDIFMMSSSFEGLPIALLEAMSMECAVVTTNAGGIKEVVRDQEDGLVCEVDNWELLSDLCLDLILDTKKLNHLKNAARKRVLEDFSLRSLVENLELEYIKNSNR